MLYIPDAGVNMILCTQLDSSGMYMLIKDGKFVFLDRRDNKSQIGCATRPRTDELLLIHGKDVKSNKIAYVSKAQVEEPQTGIDIFHRRLGHLAKDRVKKMATSFVEGIDVTDNAQIIDLTPLVEVKKIMSPATGTLVKENPDTLSFLTSLDRSMHAQLGARGK